MSDRPTFHDETAILQSGGAASAAFPAPGSGPGADAGAASGAASGAGETIVARVRRHGRHLVLPVVVLVAVAAAGGYFIGSFPELWMNLAAAGAAALIALVLGIGPILGWLSHRAVITTRRVIVHRGFFVRHRGEVSLARVREVRSKQNLVQRSFGSGDVDLFVGAEATRIADAPRAGELQSALQDLAERAYAEQVRAGGLI